MAFQDFDFESLLEAAAFQPDRVEPPAAWIGHIPFAAWLMRMTRPKVFVELGTHSGNSYFAFCQAAKAERLPIRCFAVDTWRGDEHAGLYDEEIYASVAAYNQSRFGGFSTLLRATFDDACKYFADGSIDLLHIDGLHTYEAVQHDFETWAPKLAPDAFVVFHDTNVREREFGIWKFWRELQERFPWNVEFAHCNGLGALWLGGDQPGPDWLRPKSPLKTRLPRYFASLGARIEENERSRTLIDAAAAYRSDLEGRLAVHVAQIDRLNNAVAARGEEVRQLNVSLAAHAEEVGRLNASLAARGEEVHQLNVSLAERAEEVRRLDHSLASQSKEFRRLNERLSAQERDLSSIRTAYDSKIAQWKDERANLEAQFAAHAHVLFGLQARLDKVMGSHSWRTVTALVHFPRSAGRTLRWPFTQVAFRSNGQARGWLRGLGYDRSPSISIASSNNPANSARLADERATGQLEQEASHYSNAIASVNSQMENTKQVVTEVFEPVVESYGSSTASFDADRETILVVAHEGTLSGAPILALNLVQRLADSYNVVSLLLEDGELRDHFRAASVATFVADRRNMDDAQLARVVRASISQYQVAFAIVNSVASSRTLAPLVAEGVPTVSLVHEFSSNMRPYSALFDAIRLSTETVFSTRLTLENAATEFWLSPGSSIHVIPQGKCTVPGASAEIDAIEEKTWLASRLRPLGGAPKFLVLGVGNIELRKGIDLFVDCARILSERPGGGRYRFVWIGNGFDPERDMAYSVFLDDQIKRAELELGVEILRSTSQIETAYELADVLLVTSRLDPLPNVAIDALSLGRPVLCFAKATGVADFLHDCGLGEQCVAEYLDTHDLAQKVEALADSEDLRSFVAERSRAAARKAFDMGEYIRAIESIAHKAVTNKSRVAVEVKYIVDSERFRRDFFGHAGVESATDEAVIEDYLHRSACGLGVRKPMPGFQPTVYSALSLSDAANETDPFVNFLQAGLPEGPWFEHVIQDGGKRTLLEASHSRVALHLHAFYPDQLDEVVVRLNLNVCTPDVFVSVATQAGAEEARTALSNYRGRVVDVQITPNLGRDIGPFLSQFGQALCASYDIIGHIHTKKSLHVADRSTVRAWNDFLLENLVGGDRGGAAMDAIVWEMETDPSIGIVFPDDPHVVSWTRNKRFAEEIAARMRLGSLPPEINFPAGSMFWIRSLVLSKFVALGFDWSDYPSEPVPIDGTMIHAIERLFGVAPVALGMTCAVTNIRGVTR